MKNPIQRDNETKKSEVILDEEPPSLIGLRKYRQDFLNNLKQAISEEKVAEFTSISEASREFLNKHYRS
ncbi:MAG: hypothetical protein HGB12_05425, partial [Bacteroidetes bacterium]|nr:hypothetical protein [Bacteroidota bacterium]